MPEGTKVVVKIKLNAETLNILSELADFVETPRNEFIADMLIAYFQIMDLLPSQKSLNAECN